ncbi:Dabb family protein [Desulfobaculum senezii]|jgi:hypothetical protein|uniref:Dabb family protein n=1 Tax=Desulfobaculum sp. SPO524 TaxID=3378071 RepID=UPI003853B86F
MIKHIVMWTLKDEAEGAPKAENAKRMKTMLEDLRGRVPGPLELEVGINIDPEGGVSDVALYTTFEDTDALAAYAVHPEHLKVVEFIKKVVTERRCVDYRVD